MTGKDPCFAVISRHFRRNIRSHIKRKTEKIFTVESDGRVNLTTRLHITSGRRMRTASAFLAFIFKKLLKKQKQIYTCLYFKSVNVEV